MTVYSISMTIWVGDDASLAEVTQALALQAAGHVMAGRETLLSVQDVTYLNEDEDEHVDESPDTP